MSQMNVEQFASELGVLPAVLLEQLRAAGVSKNLTVDSLTEKDKTQLLDYLRKIHGTREEKSKISLPRRQTSEIKKSDSSGKARSIQVEVRKKRVFVKGDLERPGNSRQARRGRASRARYCRPGSYAGDRCGTAGIAGRRGKKTGGIDCAANCGIEGKETA